ncbi:MAG: aminotransferase class V-fold PLP-dependent enzyme [Bdellovibrionales bacterium]|nr:aminotransferase class V-fold PLP-dependent enzyme [Bdellovibrionales bacterium]
MIYADYNGSAPLLPVVREYLKKRIDTEIYANPNAIHSIGQKVFQGIEKCREVIAEVVECYPDQLYFNSGSSEGVSHILFSVLEYAPKNKNIVITSPIEHAVIPKALKFYQERRGFKLEMVDIDDNGVVLMNSLEKLFQKHGETIALVTIMAVNNETGVIQPYEQIAKLCQQYRVEFFCDTTQLIGKGDFSFRSSGVDYAVCSGHKVGALTGTGFVMAKEPTKLKSHVFGSTQEKGLRGGTQHYIGVETLAIALSDFQTHKSKLKNLSEARLKFEAKMKKTFPEVVVVGDKVPRLAGTSLMSYPGIHGQAVQIELESHDIFVTTSAACSDNQPETSAVLKAMAINDDVGRGVIRISLSYSHGDKDYLQLEDALTSIYTKLKKIKSF